MEEFPMYKYLHNFSLKEEIELPNQEDVEYSAED